MEPLRGLGVLFIVLCALQCAAPAGAAAENNISDLRYNGEIRDIRGPLPRSGVPPFALTAGVLTGAAVTAGFLALRRKKKNDSGHTVTEESEAPLEALNRFAASYRRGGLPADLLCLHLAPLLRSALSVRTGLPGSRLTTQELLQRVEGAALLPAHDLDLAAELLDLCDRVKFAAHMPDGPEAEAFLAAAARLIGGAPEGPHEVP